MKLDRNFFICIKYVFPYKMGFFNDCKNKMFTFVYLCVIYVNTKFKLEEL